jgi:hypothetical protein
LLARYYSSARDAWDGSSGKRDFAGRDKGGSVKALLEGQRVWGIIEKCRAAHC